MSNAFDDLELGLSPEEEELESHLVGGREVSIVTLQWFSGGNEFDIPGEYRPTRQNPRPPRYEVAGQSKPVGFWYPLEAAPADFAQAIERLVAAKQAFLADIVHPGMNNGPDKVKPYAVIPNAQYCVLTHGTPAPSSIARDIKKQVGLVSGIRVDYNPDTRQTSKNTVIEVLAIVRQLYEVGYVDQEGLPAPVRLRFRGAYTNEFHAALSEHYKLVQKGVKLGLPKNLQHYWAFWQPLEPSFETVKHGKPQNGVQRSEVHTVVTGHPEEAAWDLDYLRTLFIGKDLYNVVKGYLYDLSVNPPVIGGMAVEWCREQQMWLKTRADEYADAELGLEDIAWGSNKPAPPRLIHRIEIAAAQRLGSLAGAGKQTSSRGENALEAEEVLRKNIQRLRAFFARLNSEEQPSEVQVFAQEGLKAIKAANMALDNELGLDDAEAASHAQKHLKSAEQAKQKLDAIASPY